MKPGDSAVHFAGRQIVGAGFCQRMYFDYPFMQVQRERARGQSNRVSQYYLVDRMFARCLELQHSGADRESRIDDDSGDLQAGS